MVIWSPYDHIWLYESLADDPEIQIIILYSTNYWFVCLFICDNHMIKTKWYDSHIITLSNDIHMIIFLYFFKCSSDNHQMIVRCSSNDHQMMVDQSLTITHNSPAPPTPLPLLKHRSLITRWWWWWWCYWWWSLTWWSFTTRWWWWWWWWWWY